MRLLTVELRLAVWLMLAVIAFMLLAWAARFAPWLLLMPVSWWRRRR